MINISAKNNIDRCVPDYNPQAFFCYEQNVCDIQFIYLWRYYKSISEGEIQKKDPLTGFYYMRHNIQTER